MSLGGRPKGFRHDSPKSSVIAASAASGQTVDIGAHFDTAVIYCPPLSNSASLILQVSSDNATWFNLRDSAGNPVPNWPAALVGGLVGNAFSVPRGVLTGFRYMRPVATAALNTAVTILIDLTSTD